MSKPFDAATKRLVELQPSAWLSYLGLSGEEATLMETDLTTVTSEADKILSVNGPTPYLAHIEFQSSRKEMDERVLRYNVLIHCRYHLPVQSVVVLLRREADGPQVTGRAGYIAPDGGSLDFRYDVVRMWEMPMEVALNGDLVTLPLAPLADVSLERLPEVFQRIDERFEREATPDEAGMLWTTTNLLMGLRYEREVIHRLLKGVQRMEESTTYQEILEKEARNIILRLGSKRFGPPDAQTQDILAAIEDREKLEQLAERLLETESWNELLA